MERAETTRMSSKGQVVIPETIRRRLKLTPGQHFVVVGEDDVVILKSVEVPSMRDFDRLISEARRAAKETGMQQSDVESAVSKVRGR